MPTQSPKTFGCSTLGQAGASGELGLGADILFRWNGTDITQFGPGQNYNHAGANTAMTLGTDRRDTNYISISSSGGAFTGGRLFFIQDFLLPRRFVATFRVLFDDNSGTGTGSDRFAFMWFTNGLTGANFYGIGLESPEGSSDSLILKRWQAGVRDSPDASMSSPTFADETPARFGATYWLVAEAEPSPIASTDRPQIGFYNHGWSFGAVTSRGGAIHTNQMTSLFDANWTGQTLNRVGIGHYHSNSRSHRTDISEIIIYRHPKDYVLST